MQFHLHGHMRFLLSIVATSEFQSSVTERFHRVTVGVVTADALHYAFGTRMYQCEGGSLWAVGDSASEKSVQEKEKAPKQQLPASTAAALQSPRKTRQ